MRFVVRTDAVMLQVKEKVKKLVIPLYVDDDGKIPRLHGSPAGRRQSSRHALSMLVATGTEENSRPAGKRKTNSLHCLRRTDGVNNNDDDIGPDMLTRAHSFSSSWHPHIIRVWKRLCWFFEPRFGLPLACRLSSTPEAVTEAEAEAGALQLQHTIAATTWRRGCHRQSVWRWCWHMDAPQLFGQITWSRHDTRSLSSL